MCRVKSRKTSRNSSLKALEDPQKKNRDEQWQAEIFSKDHKMQNKTVFACICEAHEFTRKRIPKTPNKYHEDHIAERGLNSVSHYNLVHKPISRSQTMKTLDAKAAVDKEREKLNNLPAWQETKVSSIERAQKYGKTVHVATLMDLRLLKKTLTWTRCSKNKKTCCSSWRRCER